MVLEALAERAAANAGPRTRLAGVVPKGAIVHGGMVERVVLPAITRDAIDAMVNDLIGETRRRLDALRPQDADTLRRCGRPTAAFSDGMRENDRALKRFLFERMYRHSTVNRMTAKARRIVTDLFNAFLAEPRLLPTEHREKAANDAPRAIADYVAGMTDRYAIREHRRLFAVGEI